MYKVIPSLLYVLLSIGLFACHSKDKKEVLQQSIKSSIIKTTPGCTCSFDSLINGSRTPELAKKLFNNDPTCSEDALVFFDSLKSNNPEVRLFYFKAITNSFAFADGAYAEGLGNLGKEFIENHTLEFAYFFDNKDCFNDHDLKIWAKIAVLEFEIIDENIEPGKGVPLAYAFSEQLITKSKNYPESIKATIQKFATYLRKEWADFLLHV